MIPAPHPTHAAASKQLIALSIIHTALAQRSGLDCKAAPGVPRLCRARRLASNLTQHGAKRGHSSAPYPPQRQIETATYTYREKRGPGYCASLDLGKLGS
jgi:hypothetical protein